MGRFLFIASTSIGLMAVGCADDVKTATHDVNSSRGDDASVASHAEGGPATDRMDAGKSFGLDAGTESILDGGRSAADLKAIARGKYLTTAVFPCGSCHTSRTDPTQVFAGVDCFSDSLPNDADAGCLSSRNLTNHETGLGNYSDDDVKKMIRKGIQPDGKALFDTMPYTVLGNMSEADSDAIVAYLRSLPAVEHRVRANQPPWDVPPSAPTPIWPEENIPQPSASYPDQASAVRGRYLAGELGHCMDCHTPRQAGKQLRTQAFQGGRTFGNAGGAPVYSPNLTPDETGIASWTVDDIVRAIKQGEDKDQGYSKFCGPMPAGPNGAYGGITDDDARDIANYLRSLSPVQNYVAGDCEMFPDGGVLNVVQGDGGK
ncbi:MAG: putative diheme cytochrome c-553 [Myxococcaceae bacterium]|nr:putative diheme cytochrome c-553 [Myxococcaceae bacterium]